MNTFNNIARKSYLKPNRQPGISFIVRCRNESKYIKRCITSLKGVKVPHEIVVILHNCTDDSRVIVEKLKLAGYPIRIFDYNLKTSKAGLETLITPMDHPHSLMAYYNFCFSKAKYNWVFKWDADFKASKPLTRFLNNELELASNTPIRYLIRCRFGFERKLHQEPYLTNALAEYYKYYFWEVPAYTKKFTNITLKKQVSITSISTKKIKQYWHAGPWFKEKDSYDAELSDKYDQVIKLLGHEPIGMGRANNKDGDRVFYLVRDNEAKLKKLKVYLTK